MAQYLSSSPAWGIQPPSSKSTSAVSAERSAKSSNPDASPKRGGWGKHRPGLLIVVCRAPEWLLKASMETNFGRQVPSLISLPQIVFGVSEMRWEEGRYQPATREIVAQTSFENSFFSEQKKPLRIRTSNQQLTKPIWMRISEHSVWSTEAVSRN